jgi:uncharacterized membrane protein
VTENLETTITQDERTMATLAHALQVAGWWLAPLIIFLTQRKSRFVSFHALQALLLQIIYMVLLAGFIAVWFLTFFLTIAQHQGDKTPPVAVFVLMPLARFGLWACGPWSW